MLLFQAMAATRDHSEEEEDEEFKKKNANTLPLWGNEKTMNLNTLLLTNIQSSHYFKGMKLLLYV